MHKLVFKFLVRILCSGIHENEKISVPKQKSLEFYLIGVGGEKNWFVGLEWPKRYKINVLASTPYTS